MKCCVVNSSEIGVFGIWVAEFYNNTSKKARAEVLAMDWDEVSEKVEDLKFRLQDMKGYKTALPNVKQEMGLLTGLGLNSKATMGLGYKPVVNLLILKTVIERLQQYQKNKLIELKGDQETILKDMKNLAQITLGEAK